MQMHFPLHFQFKQAFIVLIVLGERVSERVIESMSIQVLFVIEVRNNRNEKEGVMWRGKSIERFLCF